MAKDSKGKNGKASGGSPPVANDKKDADKKKDPPKKGGNQVIFPKIHIGTTAYNKTTFHQTTSMQ